MRNLIAAASALGLAVAPVAANAGTRANDVVPAAASIDRDIAPVTGSNMGDDSDGSAVVIAILALAAVIAGILAATSDDDDNISDG